MHAIACSIYMALLAEMFNFKYNFVAG